MAKLSASEQRYLENAVFIAASKLVFQNLQDANVPVKNLGDIADTTSGGTPLRSVSTYYGGNIPWIKSGELTDGSITKVGEFITREGLENSSAKVFPEGTVVVALYGATVGKTGILTFEAASNQAVCAVFPKTADVSNQYLFWFLRHKRQDFIDASFGGAQPNISQKVLRETCVPVPNLHLQIEICKFLSVVERRQNGEAIELPQLPSPLEDVRRIVTHIEAIAARVAEARGLRQGAVEEIMTAFDLEVKELVSSLLYATGATPLSEMTTFIGDINHQMPNAVSVGVPFISPKDFTAGGQIDFVNAKKITREDFEYFSRKCCPQRGDILMARYGTIGATRIVTGETEFLASYSIAVIRPKTDVVSSEFLHWMLSSAHVQEQAESGIRGGVMPDLGLRTIREFQIPALSRSRQDEIVQYLNNLKGTFDRIHNLQVKTAAELDALLPSLLDRAFKGEL